MTLAKNEITYQIQINPNINEISNLLTVAFEYLAPHDQANFDAESKNQSLSEWFDVNSFKDYLKHSYLIEARTAQNELVGLVLVGKQNPLTWPDGRKAEIFALAVMPKFRSQGIGSSLLSQAESKAKGMGAQKLILNTHVLLTASQHYYEKLGFNKMGILENYYGNGNAVFYSKDLTS